jgi:DNA-directed RNA polymerase subunit RPC12/RpoP
MTPEMEATAGQWTYSQCYCNVTIGERDWIYYEYKCAMCGNKNLRFIHVLKHEESRKEIEVGVECAGILVRLEHEPLPRLAENETARKEKWRRRYGTFGMCVTTIDDLENRGKW